MAPNQLFRTGKKVVEKIAERVKLGSERKKEIDQAIQELKQQYPAHADYFDYMKDLIYDAPKPWEAFQAFKRFFGPHWIQDVTQHYDEDSQETLQPQETKWMTAAEFKEQVGLPLPANAKEAALMQVNAYLPALSDETKDGPKAIYFRGFFVVVKTTNGKYQIYSMDNSKVAVSKVGRLFRGEGATVEKAFDNFMKRILLVKTAKKAVTGYFKGESIAAMFGISAFTPVFPVGIIWAWRTAKGLKQTQQTPFVFVMRTPDGKHIVKTF